MRVKNCPTFGETYNENGNMKDTILKELDLEQNNQVKDMLERNWKDREEKIDRYWEEKGK